MSKSVSRFLGFRKYFHVVTRCNLTCGEMLIRPIMCVAYYPGMPYKIFKNKIYNLFIAGKPIFINKNNVI